MNEITRQIFKPVFSGIFRGIFGGVFTPADLFALSEPGVWFDPSDLTTLYQDSIGTTPVTATSQTVGLTLDKSGNGFHATQATLASRPIYSIEPAGGRRNRLVYSGFDGAVSGTPGTAPTGWPRFLGTPNGTSIYTPNSALLGGGSMRIQTTLSRYQLGQVVPVAANTSYIISVDCDIVSGVTFNNHLDWVAPPSGATVSYRLDGVSVLGGSIVPTGLHKLEAILSVGATAGNGTMRMGIGIQANNTGDITFSNPQLELGSTATAYQRVTTAYNVTEAGVAPVPYLYDDLSGDALNWTAPAGTYSIAFVDTLGNVTIQTLQSLSGATDVLAVQKTAGYVAINRALTAAETASLTAWFKAKAGV